MLNKNLFKYSLPIIYVVGICGFFIPSLRETFILLTPITLLMSAGMLIYYHSPIDLDFIVASLIIGFLGYLVELLGVHTGFPFGLYYYEYGLGPKIMGVPPMIGINWFLLVYVCAYLVQLVIPSASLVARSLISACLMVAFDFIIEPFAIQFNLWEWEHEVVPVLNYVAWLVISFAFQLYWNKVMRKGYSNDVAVLLFISMAAFFGILLFV